MKKFLSVFIVVAMLGTLWIPGIAEESSTVTHHLTSEKSSSVTVKTGDIIEVTYSVTSPEETAIITMQNEIFYDHTFLELVPDSNEGLNGYGTSVQVNSTGKHFIYFNRMSNIKIDSAGIIAGTVKFKVIGEKGSTEIQNTSCKAYNNKYEEISSEIDNLKINVEESEEEPDDPDDPQEQKNFEDKNKPTAILPVTITYDGNEHAIFSEPSELITEAQITYYIKKDNGDWTNLNTIPTIKEKGTYEVKYTISAEGYKTFESEIATFTVKSGSSEGGNGGSSSKDSSKDDEKDGGDSDEPKTEPEEYIMKFTDVKTDDYFYDAVKWAEKNEITSGTTETHFSPMDVTTRAQMVTFLWRAAGKPEINSEKSVFTDVEPGSYYEKAVIWATEKNITKGISDTKFGSNLNVTRGQTVTFLARMEGVEDNFTAEENKFIDVKATDYYNNAVIWAVKNNITKGISETKFGPDKNCLRGEIVTFMYRDMEERDRG